MVGATHIVIYERQPTQPGEVLSLAASAMLGAELKLAGPFFLEVGAQALVPILRHRFVVEGRESTVFRESAVGMVGYGGAGFQFF